MSWKRHGRRAPARAVGLAGSLLLVALALLAPAPAGAQVDAGQVPAPHAPFDLPFEVTDAVFDAQRGMLYATSRADRRVYFVDLASGLAVRQFDFAWMPESLSMTPDGSRLYVALLTRDHSPYWWDGQHEGYIASFDLDLQRKDRQFWIAEDPFDLVATTNGHLVVSSGSGQWTHAHSFDGATGALISSISGVRHRTRLALHPSEGIVYGADTDLSPSDIERYDLDPSGKLTSRWDAVYHGDHRMSGNVWASPLGDVLITRGGDVFTAAGADRQSDMIYLRGLTPGLISTLHFDDVRNVILTAAGGTVSYYNLESLEWIGDVPTGAPRIDFVGAVGTTVYTLQSGSTSHLEAIPHLVPDGDTNTSPVAAFDVSPGSGWTTLTDITLDASPSQDAESGLVQRWDLDGDGAWDTGFSPDPFLVHRYDTAGTKFVTLQVKDHAGAVDTHLRLLDVAFEADPGTPGASHPSFTLPFEITDAVFDPVRPYVYVSSLARKQVHFLNLDTGFVEKTFDFPWMPENLAVTPDGSRLYAGLLTRSHSAYWFDGSHEGYIASFDLDLQVKDRQYWIPEDPFDLVATSNGRLVVSSGSGQWTYARAFDGATGDLLSSIRGVRHGTRLALHPGEAIVYGADNGLSPSDIERYDLDAKGTLTFLRDSPYHGQHRMSGNAWVSPLGDILVTRGGDVFTAGRPPGEDMIYLRGLTPGHIDALAYDPQRHVIFTGRDGGLSYYNLQSLESIADESVTGDVSHLGVRGLDVFAIQVESGQTLIRKLDHPLPDGDTDTPPSVEYRVLPAEGELTTLTDVTFDASGSSDAEGGLLYRWDLNGDGVWDTSFSSDPLLVHRFDIAGTKFIAVQVKDEAGFVSSTTFTVDIRFESDPGAPGQEHPGFLLSFPVTDVVFDAMRSSAYVSSQERRQVHFVNLRTGLVERTFDFALSPGSLCMTPDGSRLYAALVDPDRGDGQVAGFDLELGVKDRQFGIAADPFDLVATSNGQLVVTSGSGQWSYAYAFDGTTGALLSSIRSIRQGTRLTLHPSESIVYGADNGLSPSDIERYDLDPAGTLTFRWDSIYHGDHRMSGNVWASPWGDLLITRGGDVFTAAGADRQSDMLYLRGLTPSYMEALEYDPERNVVFTARGNEIAYYNLTSLEAIGTLQAPPGADIRFLGAGEHAVFAVSREAGQARILPFEHPVPEGGTNRPPVAHLAVEPASGQTTQTDIALDAGASEDPEGDPLRYRWDVDGDGVWDTPFEEGAVLVQRYGTAGTRFLRLQVIDAVGNVDELEWRLDVAFEPDPGMPGDVHPSYALPFEATDAVFDPQRPYAYVTSLIDHALHVVDLDTGFIARSFSFDEMPERMALSPDGSKLYVALLTRPHSSYWWDEDQEGYIARFDLDLQVKDRQFAISIDPYDLVATTDGRVVVTSGSGQWTSIGVFDGDSGAPVGTAARTIRQASVVSLHPSEGMVYTAGGTSYPQDVHRWDLGAPAGIQYAWDSIYHGHHRVGNGVWVSPLGDVLVTAGGDVFSAGGASRNEDIQYLRSISASWFLDLVWSPGLDEFTATDGSRVLVYDMTTWTELASFDLTGDARFVGRRGALLYALEVGGGESLLRVLAR